MTAASAAVVDSSGTVESVIIIDIDAQRATDFTLPDADVVVLDDGSPVNIGWTYDGIGFTAPEGND